MTARSVPDGRIARLIPRREVVAVGVETAPGQSPLSQLDDLLAVRVVDRGRVLHVVRRQVVFVTQAQRERHVPRYAPGVGGEEVGRAGPGRLHGLAPCRERVARQSEQEIGECILGERLVRKVDTSAREDVAEAVLADAALLESDLNEMPSARVAEGVGNLPGRDRADLRVVVFPAERRVARDLDEAESEVDVASRKVRQANLAVEARPAVLVERPVANPVEAEAGLVDPVGTERVRFGKHQVLASLFEIVAVAGNRRELLRTVGLHADAVAEAVPA